MKILIFILSLFFLIYFFNPYNYVGKKVRIETRLNTYIGIIINVLEIEFCNQHDKYGNCLEKKFIQTIDIVTKEKGRIYIPCKDIIKIEEING